MLIRERVAQINVCLFCIDIGRWYTIQQSMKQAKFDALDDYATSPLFTKAEGAALDYVTEQRTRRSAQTPSRGSPTITPSARSARSSGSSPASMCTT